MIIGHSFWFKRNVLDNSFFLYLYLFIGRRNHWIFLSFLLFTWIFPFYPSDSMVSRNISHALISAPFYFIFPSTRSFCSVEFYYRITCGLSPFSIVCPRAVGRQLTLYYPPELTNRQKIVTQNSKFENEKLKRCHLQWQRKWRLKMKNNY